MIVRSFNPIWLFVDLNGNILDDTYYLFTLESTLPYLPSPIWKDQNKNAVWPDPIQFLANGTLPENMYWDTTKTYRLEVRQGNTQAAQLIYEVNNYIPGSSSGPVPPSSSSINTENEITNPQFATMNFSGTLTITTATTTEIAPGWFIDTVGPGTSLDVSQTTYSGDAFAPGNPSNAATGLTLVNNGFTSVVLRQRFDGNGALWTGAESEQSAGPGVAITYTASSATPVDMSARIDYSNGSESRLIFKETLASSNQEYQGAEPILASTNTDGPDVAWTDFSLSFTGNTTVKITSVQLIGQNVVQKMPYIQDTPERQVDHEFNYYKTGLVYKPIPSYLVGWDFPLNPAQLPVTSSVGANKSKYVWDQTIVFQSANAGVTTARGSAGELLLTAAATTQMAIIQYLPQEQARKILNAPICVNVSANASVSKVATVSLWYTKDASLPVVATGTNNSIVAALDSNGKPSSFNGTWFEVPRTNGNAKITIETSSDTNFNDYPLSGWDMDGVADVNAATFFAIVIGTASVTIGSTVGFNSVSLQNGYIPTRPAPQTQDEVIRECAYYYETSKNVGTEISASPLGGALIRPMAVFDVAGPLRTEFWPRSFGIQFNVTKRVVPTVTLYAEEGGSAGIVRGYIRSGTLTPSGQNTLTVTNYWTTVGASSVTLVGTKGIQYLSKYDITANGIFQGTALAGVNNTTEAFISFHYEADARLGIV